MIISISKRHNPHPQPEHGFNKTNVTRFSEILKTVQNNHSYSAHQIYNCDETGLFTVQTRNSKVFALKGRRQVGAITSEAFNVGSLESAVVKFIHPFIIFSRKNMKAELADRAGPEFACTPSGWMQTKPCQAFGRSSSPSNFRWACDTYKARENHTTVICLPPHCSHKLQPLDATFKAYYIQECEKFPRNNPGRAITQYQISKLLGEAFLRAAVPTRAIHGFRDIFPLNPNVFCDADFLTAEVSDILMNDANNDEGLSEGENEANHINALEKHEDG
ncbi:hypothetical protein JTB14_028889 [Gonioctena quinquepunctata]|nr:hypothetical protein JTB14_028889 [Gonioctena quinquepunctata]